MRSGSVTWRWMGALFMGWAQVAEAQGPFVYRDTRADLAHARARGDTLVRFAIAAREGQTAAAAATVSAAGGTVEYRADDVSYLRARLHVDSVPRLMSAASIEAMAMDMIGNNRPFTRWAGAEGFPSDTLRRTPDDALGRPYSPLADIDALEMRRRDPTRDGRGVVVAHVEGHIDLLAPEFQVARAPDGRRIPKVVDFLTAEDPDVLPEDDPSSFAPWVKVSREVRASGGTLSVDGTTYTAPRDGPFRFGVFRNMRLCGFLAGRMFDAFAADTAAEAHRSCGYAVLLDAATGDVWVDVNRDRSFQDSRAMRDYRVRQDRGTFGVDNPATPHDRETFGFAVQVHPEKKAVAINVGFGGHSTMVAGTVVGSRGTNGRYEGVAPGAQVLEIGYRATASGVTEALILAFRDPRSDVVLFEQNVFIAMGYRVGDGRFAPTIITSRLIAKYQKPFCVPASNLPGVGITAEHGNAQHGFAVGAYQGREAWRINNGVRLRHADNVHSVSSGGPGGDGAIKPDLMAPSGILSSAIAMRFYEARGGVRGIYGLPPGYSIGGGTSQATPTMAGALALLIGAAKAEKLPHDARRVWLAMTNGARYMDNLPAHMQGNGLVQVGAALELLRAWSTRAPALRLTSRAPVTGAHATDLATAGEGVGLWERTGWTVGARATRAIHFTLRGGSDSAMTFRVTARGNDGTFRVPASIRLSPGVPASLDVEISPATAGAHSVLITLDHPSVVGHAFRTMASIVVAQRLDAAAKYTLTWKDSIERPGPWRAHFIDVPAGTQALALDLVAGAEARLSILDPLGREEDFNAESVRNPRARTIPNPMPGTWEVDVSMRNDGGELRWQAPDATIDPALPYTLTASALAARLQVPAPGPLTAGAPRAITVNAENVMAPLTAAVARSATGIMRVEPLTLTEGTQRVSTVTVPEGAEFLQVDLGENIAVGPDLYLFDCTGKRCVPAAAAIGPQAGPLLRRE
ncbi:MAG: S8 family serine peptidase, partial [Cytophagaceae bacterium]|nr:S8 family serine peptidase [Gemmatimonadaceae bacterium]